MASKAVTKTKKSRPSTTGKRRPNVDQSNWRTRLQESRVKFDDDQKETFLLEYARCGRKGQAAKVAGVSPQTVNNHIDHDPDFEEAVDQALDAYRAMVGGEVRRRGVEGWDEPLYYQGQRATEPILDENGAQVKDDEGNPLFRLVSVRKFDGSLLMAEAKRVDPAYRDKALLNLDTGGGGVIVAPADMTPEEWIQKYQDKNLEMQANNTRLDGSLVEEDD